MDLIDLDNEQSKNDDVIVGIDLGTTESWIAFQDKNGNVQIIPDENGESKSTPSIVGIFNGEMFIGNNVSKHCKSFHSFKRLMSGNLDHYKYFGEKNNCTIDYKKKCLIIDGNRFSPIHFSAMILQKLKNDAECFFNHKVQKAVITIPAYFDEGARNATKQAAEIAGLEVRRLINEPTAAALAYKINKQDKGLYLVFDLGGGTFDISLLKLHEGVIQVLAVDGSLKLGGDDIDEIIFQKIYDLFKTKYDNFEISQQDKRVLYAAAKEIKESFSQKNIFSSIIAVSIFEISFRYSIDDFEHDIAEFVRQTIEITRSVLIKKDIKPEKLDGIILVGGSTRIKLVKRELQKIHSNVLNNINPDEIVVRGAAIQAYNLGNKTGDLLIDVLPISLGIETSIGVDEQKGLMEKLLFRNSPLPIKNKKTFTTSIDNQSEILINIYQGELENVENNLLLKKFIFTNIPPMPAYKPEVEVEFFVDVDGLLSISAIEKNTKTQQEFVCNMLFGAPKHDINGFLRQQLQQMASDQKQKKQKILEMDVKKTIDILQKIRSSISDDQCEEISFFLQLFKNALTIKEKQDILARSSRKMASYIENFLQKKIKIK